MQVFTLILIIAALLPAVLISWFVYKKDRVKEPMKLLILLFLLGVCSAFLVIFISAILEIFFPFLAYATSQLSIAELLIQVFIEVALVEEVCKWLIVYKFGYKNKAFDETYDVIVYAVFVALGFATFENLLYVLENNSLSIALLRAVLSIPAHVSFEILMGYFLCMAKIYKLKNNTKKVKQSIIKSILVPTIMHGIYDFCLFVDKPIFFMFFVIFVIVLFTIAFLQLKETYKENASLLAIKKQCKKCKLIYQGNNCPRCGSRQD